MSTLRIDAEPFLADLEQLAAFGGHARDRGVTRIACTPADLQARDWVEARLRELGLAVQRDAIGNTIARLDGAADARAIAARAIAIGSHTDTVPNGGRFDGALGVIAALAVARAIRRNGIRLRHALEVLNFMAEEATLSGGTLGSAAMAGRFDPAQLDRPAWDGRPVRAHLQAAGLDPDAWRTAVRSREAFAAYLELHIEQGATLTEREHQIGVVEGMVGIRRYRVTFAGRANHAGTTPMHRRDDALVKAAPFVQRVREVALSYGIIGTVGVFEALPGAANVIPGQVNMIVELRALQMSRLDAAGTALGKIAAGMGGTMQMTTDKPPVMCDARLVEVIAQAGAALGCSTLRMPSGAFHDAANMATLCPAGMIFVPSQGGISHAPDEFTTAEDCIAGATVLLNAVLALDERPAW